MEALPSEDFNDGVQDAWQREDCQGAPSSNLLCTCLYICTEEFNRLATGYF